jgi:predicted NAD/FAD-dependent oxidoreductase
MNSRQEGRYEVIVVGAGLAGLAAAYELDSRGTRTLVLEGSDRVGGKILTRQKANTRYECGALFAFSPDWVPFPVDAGNLISENHPIGVFLDGRVVAGESVPACLQAIGISSRQAHLLGSFLGSESPQRNTIGDEIYSVLEAFFRVIHPGDLADYVPARRNDSLVRHSTARFESGNNTLVQKFIENISSEAQTSCQVTRLHTNDEGVTVHWNAGGEERSARADWVVLATPAAEARALTVELESVATDFLAGVRYGKGIAVAIGLRNASYQPYSYIVCPTGPANTLAFRHPGEATDLTVITAYLVGEAAENHWHSRDREIVELLCSQVNRMKIGEAVSTESLAFSDVYRWPAIGPIISEETYGTFCNACLFPSNRIVLAGDYTWWTHQQMPYGMYAAIQSGQRAAEIVCRDHHGPPAQRFRPEPLSVSITTSLTELGPTFENRIDDGTVAYYGLILQAAPDTDLEHYLVGEAEDGLWAYQQGYGVTSLDSALVMEGLLATGRHEALLSHSVDRLIEEFYDQDEGAFRTIPHSRVGRAPYWEATDCPATGYCAWLLTQIAPGRYDEVVRACATYLKRKQYVTGRWPGKWFPSQTIPVFYAVRLLATMGTEFSESCRRAELWLYSRQRKDGSWTDSVIESAAAIRALCRLGNHSESVRKGCHWIRNRQAPGAAWSGEPILQYWFEEEHKKTFFHTEDKGRITTAWATLALREVDRLL